MEYLEYSSAANYFIFSKPLDFCINIIYTVFVPDKEVRQTVRTGRPTKDPKKLWLGMRLSEKEKEKIDFCMKKTGWSKTQVIKEGIDRVYQSLLEKETDAKKEQ